MKILGGRSKDRDLVAIIAAQGPSLNYDRRRAILELLEKALDRSDLLAELERARAEATRWRPCPSRAVVGGGGGNRTARTSPDSEDSRRVSRTGFEENTSKQHEQNALPAILMTMSRIPDVNRELAEVVAMFATFDVLRQNRGR
jgi:hypothetical protein